MGFDADASREAILALPSGTMDEIIEYVTGELLSSGTQAVLHQYGISTASSERHQYGISTASWRCPAVRRYHGRDHGVRHR